MCGICGFTGQPDHRSLRGMMDAIIHRGPDEAGSWEDEAVSLGMRRLAIIDLSSGQQPVFNEDHTIAVVFNGEIYNHPELRAALIAQGHQFRTHHSDTEVLVHLYEQYGDDFLHHLNGMFAIALWDGPKRRLLLARDRVGIKPLYFTSLGQRLLFASEIKSLLAHEGVVAHPDLPALYHYFSCKNVPAPRSAFQGIHQLRPGERILFADGEIRTETWWRIRFGGHEALGEEEAAVRIRQLLEESVQLQMRSDVPFGAYLSGGVDSSSIVALMTRLGGRQVKTFALVYADNFPNKTMDQVFARQVAECYQTEHHEYELNDQEVVDSLEAVLHAFDEPFSGVTSTYFLTQLISRHVKVALSGDGADELFGSYLAHRLARPLAWLDRASGADTEPLMPYQDKIDWLREIHGRGDEATRRASLLVWTDAAKKTELLSQAMLEACARANAGENTEAMIRSLYAQADTDDPLNRALYCDWTTLLPDQVLAFVDRLSMAHSVEVRPPFLDHRLVEFAASLPGKYKIKGGVNKSILKKAVGDLLPEGVIQRPKEGFVLPIDDWLLTKLETMVRDTLSGSRLQRHGLLREDTVNRILQEHFGRTAQHGQRIWNLLMFQIWWDKFIHG